MEIGRNFLPENGFTIIPNSVINKVTTGELSKADLGHYVVIRSFSDGKYSPVIAKPETIGNRAGMSGQGMRRSTQRLNRKLEESGVIAICNGGGRGNVSAIYFSKTHTNRDKSEHKPRQIESKTVTKPESCVSAETKAGSRNSEQMDQPTNNQQIQEYQPTRNPGGGGFEKIGQESQPIRLLAELGLRKLATDLIKRHPERVTVDFLTALRDKIRSDATLNNQVGYARWAIESGKWVHEQPKQAKSKPSGPPTQLRTCKSCGNETATASKTDHYHCPSCRSKGQTLQESKDRERVKAIFAAYKMRNGIENQVKREVKSRN